MQEYYVEVGTANFRDKLYRRLSDLRTVEGLPFELYELKNDAPYLVRCVYSSLKGRQEEDRLTVKIYNYYFARALAEIIFQEWEQGFIKKILSKEYRFNFSEIKNIFEKSWRKNIEHRPAFSDPKKRVLIKSILEFLDSHQRFNIEGFMNFRAEQYKRELRKQIAKAVNDYILAQEHQNFIAMLKRFLQKQTPIFPTIHLVIKAQGDVQFYDDQGKNISKECIADYNKTDIELYEDFLINTILKCAPRQLVVHALPENHVGMMEIMNDVFEEKISVCYGCSLCYEGH